MKTIFIALTVLCLTAACAAEPDEQHELPPFGAHLPEGYELVYETDFDQDKVLEDFVFTDPAIWRLAQSEGDTYLELFERIGAYKPEVRSPHAIALLATCTVGDFILELDVESTNVKAGAHRDTCYFFGVANPANFYYVHIAKAADPNAHNIFRVKDAPRTNIATFTTKGVDWGVGIRHRIRIHRTIADGAIRVYFNDVETPIMEATDTNFDWGQVGFGSFDDTARFFAMKMYAPEVRQPSELFFEKKSHETGS